MSKLFQDCRLEVQNGFGNVCCVLRVCRDTGTSSASANYCALSRVGTDDLMSSFQSESSYGPWKNLSLKPSNLAEEGHIIQEQNMSFTSIAQ